MVFFQYVFPYKHKADEYIRTQEIREGIDKYIEFIETFYGNTLE